MTFEEVQNSVNEWLFDYELGTYIWILNVDVQTKIICAKGLSGRETELLFSPNRFFRNAQKNIFAR